MGNTLGHQKPLSIESPLRMFKTDSDIKLAARHLRRSRQIQAIAILVGVPLVLAEMAMACI